MPPTMPDEALHIDLDLHVHDGEVEGLAATKGHPERPFSGWIELLAALDAIIESGGEKRLSEAPRPDAAHDSGGEQ
jgi:hypothetical protein